MNFWFGQHVKKLFINIFSFLYKIQAPSPPQLAEMSAMNVDFFGRAPLSIYETTFPLFINSVNKMSTKYPFLKEYSI